MILNINFLERFVTIAGYSDVVTKSAKVERYNFETKKWGIYPDVSKGKVSSPFGMVFNDKIWLMGGYWASGHAETYVLRNGSDSKFFEKLKH